MPDAKKNFNKAATFVTPMAAETGRLPRAPDQERGQVVADRPLPACACIPNAKTASPYYRLRRRSLKPERAPLREDFARLMRSWTYIDPARSRVAQTRGPVIEGWVTVADTLERQGEVLLARDVRIFVSRLPQPRTDKELLAEQFAAHVRANKAARGGRGDCVL